MNELIKALEPFADLLETPLEAATNIDGLVDYLQIDPQDIQRAKDVLHRLEASGANWSNETLRVLTEAGDEVLVSANIWDALGILTNLLGAAAGCHLETLLCKEIHENASTENKSGD